jgi:SAM-dependent methyltransferase
MKVRDSGMPEAATWESFFDPRAILGKLAFDDPRADVVDFGCGHGTFAVAAARMTAGRVHALDLDPAMVAATAARAATLGLANLRAIERDFIDDGTGLPDASVGYAMLFNLLHAEDPMRLVLEARRVLRPGGRLAIIHWVHDPATPRGPALGIRPRPAQCRAWLEEAGLHIPMPGVALPPFHFGVVGLRR